MRIILLSLLFCAAVMGFGNFAVGQTTLQTTVKSAVRQVPPSAHDFAEALNRQFEISPDGNKLAFLAGSGADTKVVILDLNTRVASVIPIDGLLSVAKRVQWLGDEYVLLSVSFAICSSCNRRWTGHIDQYMTFNLTNGQIANMNPANATIGFGVGTLERATIGNSNKIVFSVPTRSGQKLYLTDPATGRGREISSGGPYVSYWVFDAAGAARVRYDNDLLRNKESIWVSEGNGWRKLIDFNRTGERPFQPIAILDSDHAAVIIRENDHDILKKLNLQTGELSSMDTIRALSVDGIKIDPHLGTPVAIKYEGFQPQLGWFDTELERIHATLSATFSGKHVYLNNWSKDRKKFVVGVESGSSPYQEYLYDASANQAELLTELPEGLASFEFPQKTQLKFNARDGLEIPVFVTKPTNAGARRLPTIIMPHGGPESQDNGGFDFIAQFLVSRGYLVIQPQFRGSTGNGVAFAKAGYGEWGGKMQNDVSDSLKWAVDQGWADSSRVCIVGASYGGYAALAGATMTPELYACAISFAGVSDLELMLYEEQHMSGRISSEIRYWRNHIGAANQSVQALRSISPSHMASNVRAPILLMHGKDDSTVLISQSRQMANALRRAEKNYQIIELDGEDHNLTRQETRERFLTEMERFLAPILRPEQ